jgi:hypothetical protein
MNPQLLTESLKTIATALGWSLQEINQDQDLIEVTVSRPASDLTQQWRDIHRMRLSTLLSANSWVERTVTQTPDTMALTYQLAFDDDVPDMPDTYPEQD